MSAKREDGSYSETGFRRPYCIVTDQGKAVNGRILEQFMRAEKAESKQLTDMDAASSAGAEGLIEPPLNPKHLTELLKMSTTHKRCVATKAREGAGLGFEIVPVGVDKPTVTPPGAKPPENKRILQEFFEGMDEDLNNILVKILTDFGTLGYAAMEIIPSDEEDGPPEDLKHIPAQYLKRHRDKKRYAMVRGTKKRWFKDVQLDIDIDDETGQPLGTMPQSQLPRPVQHPGDASLPDELLLPEDRPGRDRRANPLVWFRQYSPDTDYYGMPDVLPAIGAIVGDIARRDYNIAFFDNYGVPAYAVFITGNFDPGRPVDENGNPDPNGRTPLEAAVEDHFAQLAEKPHSTMLLSIPSSDGGEGDVEVKIERLGHEMQDASFRNYRSDNRDEILSAHGVPAERAAIHVEGSLGGNIARESTEIYKRSILEPLQQMLELAINRFIVRGGFGISDFEFKLGELDVRDLEAEFRRDIQMVQFGILSINEFRDRWQLPRVADPALDMHYVQGRPIDAGDNELPTSLFAPGGVPGGMSALPGVGPNGGGELGGRPGAQPDPSVTGPAVDRGVRRVIPRNPSTNGAGN